MMVNSKIYILNLFIILLILVVSIFIKELFLPVPNREQIQERAISYVKQYSDSPQSGGIYRDYGGNSGINSWEVYVYYYLDAQMEKVHVYNFRYHPITGKIISLEEYDTTSLYSGEA